MQLFRFRIRLPIVLLFVARSAIATAESGGASPAPILVLEEVIVTAQHREQSVRDIPLTIDVLDGDALSELNIITMTEMANYVPGLIIQDAPNNLQNITIRGLGTQAGSETYDQSVGLFIDGIYAGRQREFQTALFDIERIEVIKGSQASIMGKNTSLGAISLVTRIPGDRFGGYLQGDYEFAYGSYSAGGALDVPVLNGGLRLAVNHVTQKPYVENQATGNSVPIRTQNSGRLTAIFEVSQHGLLTLGYELSDLTIKGDTYQITKDDAGIIAGNSVAVFSGEPGLDPGADTGLDLVKSAFTAIGDNGEASDEQQSSRAYLKYEQAIGSHIVTALSGWSNYDNKRVVDSDFISGDYLNSTSDSEFSQFTQELRLTSERSNAFDYIVGVFYLDSGIDIVEGTDANFPYPPVGIALPTDPPTILEIDGGSSKVYNQDTRVYSVFGQGNWSITQRLRANLGLRWTQEKKDAVFTNVESRAGPAVGILRPLFPPTSLQRSEQNVDGSICVQYDVLNTTMIYSSWSKGTKSGGFSTEVNYPDEAEYDTEVAKTTELGIKTLLSQGLVELNTALFYTVIDDFQTVRFTGLGFEISTIPATSKGVEFDGIWMINQSILASGAVTYADATESDTGDQLNNAPKWSASLGLRYLYRIGVRDLQLIVGGDVNYIGKRFAQRGETFPMEPMTLLDLRIALTNLDETYEIALLGRNLSNGVSSFQFDYPLLGQFVPGTTEVGGINRPRTITLQLGYKF